MCGIAAAISLNIKHTIDPSFIEQMNAAQIHRGPDDQGAFSSAYISMGQTRLSIIDLTKGHQPMRTHGGRYTIVFNGEIFNYRELKEELKLQNVEFVTDSDTEVVLQGYAHYGPSFLSKLQGMYSAIIYDQVEQTAVIFRDPFGIKPLYVAQTEDTLFVASEIKALKKVFPRNFTLNATPLSTYFLLGYVPGSETLIKEVNRVSAGDVIRIRVGTKEQTCIYKVTTLSPRHLSEGHTGNNLQSTLIKAIERSLVADVPVGLYLSGGVDSGLIAAIAKNELGKNLECFTVSFPQDAAFDELKHTQSLAKHLGLRLHELPVEGEFFSNLEEMVKILEEPLVDPSAMALSRLAGFVKAQGYKVALCGDGGDELFGGYSRYSRDLLADIFLACPQALRDFSLKCFSNIPPYKEAAQKFTRSMLEKREWRYPLWFSPFYPDEVRALSPGDKLVAEDFFSGLFLDSAHLSKSLQLQWVDIQTFLRDDLLLKSDKVSMHHGVEVRVPFLQADVLGSAFQKNYSHVGLFSTKRELKKIFSRYVPASYAYRKKRGFEFPIDAWIKTHWKKYVESCLHEDQLQARPWGSSPLIPKMMGDHFSGAKNRGKAILSLVLLELWHREYIDN